MLRGDLETCPLPLVSKDGRIVPVETRAWPGRWNGAECIFGISKNLMASRKPSSVLSASSATTPRPWPSPACLTGGLWTSTTPG